MAGRYGRQRNHEDADEWRDHRCDRFRADDLTGWRKRQSSAVREAAARNKDRHWQSAERHSAGTFDPSTKERLDALEAAQDELENKIACEKLAKPRITEEQLRFFLEKFRKMDVANQAQRKMLIDTFVNAIFLYDDKVVLTYNFHKGTETISFEALQKVTEAGASGSDLVSSAAPAKSLENIEFLGLFLCLFTLITLYSSIAYPLTVQA